MCIRDRNTGIVSGDVQMPALVQAAGTENPELRTRVLSAAGPQSVRTEIVTGPGVRLDELRTAAVPSSATEQDERLAEVVGALASTGDEVRTQEVLAANDIGFVLLKNSGESTERSQLQSAFDQQTALEGAGQTAHRLLWRVIADGASAEQADEDGGPSWIAGVSNALFASLLWWAQIVVLGAMFLLCLLYTSLLVTVRQ